MICVVIIKKKYSNSRVLLSSFLLDSLNNESTVLVPFAITFSSRVLTTQKTTSESARIEFCGHLLNRSHWIAELTYSLKYRPYLICYNVKKRCAKIQRWMKFRRVIIYVKEINGNLYFLFG